MCRRDVELAGASNVASAHGSGADVDPRRLEEESRRLCGVVGVPGIDMDSEGE